MYVCTCYSAPSRFLLRGAPDYSADTESEFHVEAHEQLRVKDLPRVPARQPSDCKAPNIPLHHHKMRLLLRVPSSPFYHFLKTVLFHLPRSGAPLSRDLERVLYKD